MVDGYYTDLAVLGLADQDDYRLMRELLGRDPPEDVWIGAHGDNHCNFNWVDGRELPQESIFWYSLSPSSCDTQQHVEINFPSFTNRQVLYNENGDNMYPFICQMFQSS